MCRVLFDGQIGMWGGVCQLMNSKLDDERWLERQIRFEKIGPYLNWMEPKLIISSHILFGLFEKSEVEVKYFNSSGAYDILVISKSFIIVE